MVDDQVAWRAGIKVGDLVNCRVIRHVPFGFFVALDESREGIVERWYRRRTCAQFQRNSCARFSAGILWLRTGPQLGASFFGGVKDEYRVVAWRGRARSPSEAAVLTTRSVGSFHRQAAADARGRGGIRWMRGDRIVNVLGHCFRRTRTQRAKAPPLEHQLVARTLATRSTGVRIWLQG